MPTIVLISVKTQAGVPPRLSTDRWQRLQPFAYICPLPRMPAPTKPVIAIRDLRTLEDLTQAIALEKEVWSSDDADLTSLTFAIASREAGHLWLGAFDGPKLVGFAFAFHTLEQGRPGLHSHMLAVRESYRESDVGTKLKLAQRDRALAQKIREITWTFDPLQSKNAHLNFAKLGVVSESYKVDFYGAQTSSALHQNGTDRLWVRWPVASRRVEDRLRGKNPRPEMLDALSVLQPLVRFNGEGRPARSDLSAALTRQRIAIELPSNIGELEAADFALAKEWREATRWAFNEALKSGFFVAEFCRTVRGQQGPGVYLLEKGTIGEYVPELVA
jgi:predicted GNAT superfamily acetyltransferase